MFHVVRWVTVHPALAHFTIGGLPLIVIGYAIAVWRRSPAWTLVGDAALVVTAALTLGTGAFGLVANTQPWPGGLETWRWIHLATGVATTLLLATLAALRIVFRGDEAAGPRTLGAALVVATLAGFTGWVGGEVLVFHGGMAVRAAAEGALAPPVRETSERPRDFLAAMRQARAAWAAIDTRLAWMLVHEPRDDELARIEHEAHRLAALAGVMADEGQKDPADGDVLSSMAQSLAGDADAIADAAKRRSLQDLAKAVGETSSDCADCHEQTRWKRASPAQQRRR